MKRSKLSILLCAAIFAQLLIFDSLAETTPESVLKMADRARGNVDGIEWTIKLESIEREKRQFRTLKVKAKSFNAVAKFLSPSNVKGRKLLMVDRNMWFIKPGLRKAISISPRQKLLGDASNGDIAATNYSGDYKTISVGQEEILGEKCYVYDLKGKTKRVTYDRIKYWVSVNRKVGIKAEYYTVSGKMFKSATIEYKNKIKINGSIQLFMSKMEIVNTFMDSNITKLIYKNIKLKKLSDSTFNINLLLR